jgi:phosphoesterase RecJ-like protein
MSEGRSVSEPLEKVSAAPAPQWDDATRVLRGAKEVAIVCHVNPDGDAIGSVLAASLGLRKNGVATYPSWGSDPLRVPPSYAFLPEADSLVQPADVPSTEVFLALDCGAADRLGVLEERARAATHLINIDHHPGNELFGTINIVIENASSTAELVARILRDLNIEFDKDIATCLYTGVVTDTGRFQYASSTPDTLRLAADLLSFGVPAPEIAHEVFESSPFGYLKLVGRVLDRARLFEEERFVYSWITLADLEETAVALDETEKLIDLVRSTRAADVAALFKEQPDGKYRVSLRSKGPRSVGAIARARGGGGHELAAGFTAEDVDKTAEEIRTALRAR